MGTFAALFAFARLLSASDAGGDAHLFSVTVTQNGQAIPVVEGEATLERAPFELVLRMRRSGGVLLDVSQETDTFFALRNTDHLDEVPELQYGKAFAEDNFNPEEDLNVDMEGFHNLYVDGENDHRFSSAKREADGWTCIRKVSAFTLSQGGKPLPVTDSRYDALHLAFVCPRKFRTLRGEMEMVLQKELLTLRFRD